MLELKLFGLAVLYVATGGAFFSERFRKHKWLTGFAALVSIVGTYYLLNDVIRDIKASVRVTDNARPEPEVLTLNADDLQFIQFEAYPEGYTKVSTTKSVYYREGGVLLQKKRPGDISSCRLWMNSDYAGYEKEFPLPNGYLGFSECMKGQHALLRDCMGEIYKRHHDKSMHYSQDQLAGVGQGARWIKISYVTNYEIDKNLCFNLNCGSFRTKDTCFPNK